MLDIQLRPFKDQIFDPWCRYIPASITPLYITVLAFACGLLSCLFTTQQQIILSLSFWILNRALDCVDGALARHRKAASDLGGFLDLLGDFIVYSLVPIAVAEGWDTSRHTLRAVTLLEASFHINNFILFYVAAVSEKGAKDTRNSKSRELTSVMMKPALIEGTESGVLFTLMLALPGHIGMLSYVMAALVTDQNTDLVRVMEGSKVQDLVMETNKSKQAFSEHDIDSQDKHNGEGGNQPSFLGHHDSGLVPQPDVPWWRISVSLAVLFLNYFLAQYDKFILSYFQDDVIKSVHLTQASYGILSGYATGIVYALLALPAAYVADYTGARVWVLTVAALWWSLCAIFQGLSHNFWQILLARIGMGIGQAPVEALSVSLISDLMGKRYVFFGESVLYVGVYIGEAVSGQIATAFTKSNTPWNTALIAIGIVGVVVAIFVRLLVREPQRQTSLVQSRYPQTIGEHGENYGTKNKLRLARTDVRATFAYLLRMRSFWLLTLSASFRQLSGNVFGYYMPTYLSTLYSSHINLLSRYGIIVGVVGSIAVLLGGLLTSTFWRQTKVLPLYLTAVGGMISSIFVLLMLFSRKASDNSENQGIKVLYGTMSVAYLTAELWLGAINSLIALLLPPHYKTFGLSIWAATQVLIYSAGPEIIGLAIRKVESGSSEYLINTRVALAVIIPTGYWLAGIGFLLAIPLVKQDLAGAFVEGKLTIQRRMAFIAFAVVLAIMVIVLFVISIVYRD